MIYLDSCATTPPDPEIIELMRETSGKLCGNPSSIHGPGRQSKAVLNDARTRVARYLGTSPGRIVFTSSATESNNTAIKGVALRSSKRPVRLVVSGIEHDSVLHPALYLADRFDWVELVEVGACENGVVDPGELERACESGVSLLCLMAVNNETGVIQDVRAASEIAHRHGGLCHVDAVQAAGRMQIDVEDWGCDFLSLAGHKVYGPPGVGVLYVRAAKTLDSLIHGGHQEKGLRGGTESVPTALGMARALELADERRDEFAERMIQLETSFLDILEANCRDFEINGSRADKVPGVMNLSFRGAASHDIVIGMDLEGVAISAGAACSSGVIELSHVLQAMGLETWRLEGGVRISFGRGNEKHEVETAGEKLSQLVARIRREQPKTSLASDSLT